MGHVNGADELKPDFISAGAFLEQAQLAYAAGDTTTYEAARKLVALALGIETAVPLNVQATRLKRR